MNPYRALRLGWRLTPLVWLPVVWLVLHVGGWWHP